jgi:hypothetical protein
MEKERKGRPPRTQRGEAVPDGRIGTSFFFFFGDRRIGRTVSCGGAMRAKSYTPPFVACTLAPRTKFN